MTPTTQATPGHHPMGCQHKLYMLTCEEFDELRAAARGVCARCGRSDRPIVVDHDHSIGDWAVRGMVCHQCNAIMALVDAGKRPPTGLTADYLASAWHKERPPKVRTFPRSPCPACGGNVLWSRKTGLFHRHTMPDGVPCSKSRQPTSGVELPPQEERKRRRRHAHRHRSIVFHDRDWFLGGIAAKAMGTTRSAVAEQLWAWYLRLPGAELPERPPPEVIERAFAEWRAQQGDAGE